MATKAEIILSARDATKAAFASIGDSFDKLQGRLGGLSGKLGALGGIGLAVTGAFAALENVQAIKILDQLDEMYKFETPKSLVDAEYNGIWSQVNNDLAQSGRTFEDEGTTEDKAQEEYKTLAERRVRLGLVLSEIGEKAGVEVSEDEMQRAIYEQLRQYPGQEKQILDFFRSQPGAAASIRAPIFEEKVVDHLLGEIKVTDKTVSKDELMADDEEGSEKEAKKAAPKKKAAAKAEAAEGEEAAPKKKAPAKKKAAEGDAE